MRLIGQHNLLRKIGKILKIFLFLVYCNTLVQTLLKKILDPPSSPPGSRN